MPKYRRNRVNDAVCRELSEILREVKDPRVSDVMLTITAADVTGDLKYAKIYYSVLGECDERELTRGLKSVSPFARRELAQRLNMRATPELSFHRDDGVAHGAHIAGLINKIKADAPETDESADEVEDDE